MSKTTPDMKCCLSSLTFYVSIYISLKEMEFAGSKFQPLKQDRTCWKSLWLSLIGLYLSLAL